MIDRDSRTPREPHDKRTIDRAVNVLDDHDYESIGREVRRLQADHDRLREAIEEYLLWEPGRHGHAAAHRKLQKALNA